MTLSDIEIYSALMREREGERQQTEPEVWTSEENVAHMKVWLQKEIVDFLNDFHFRLNLKKPDVIHDPNMTSDLLLFYILNST